MIDFGRSGAAEYRVLAVPPGALAAMRSTDQLRSAITTAIEEIASSGRVVIASHGASHALTGNHVLRVLVVSPTNVRVARMAELQDLDSDVASDQVSKADSSRRDYLKRFYGIDRESPTQYDLVVNTDGIDPDARSDSGTRVRVGPPALAAPPGWAQRGRVFYAVRQWASRAERDWRAHGTAYELVRVLTAPARRVLVRLDVEGAEHLPESGPAIVVANHVSFFDSVALMFELPRPVAFVGKAEYTNNPVTRWLFCGAGMIPVRRQDPSDLPHVFDEVAEVLGRGEVIGVFPEGTRSRDGRLHRGHVGAAHLALTTGAPIVPAGIVGTDKVLPTGARLVRPFQHVTIRLGEPIAAGGGRSTNRARRELTDRVMGDIARLCGEPYVDEYASLPSS